MGHFPKDPLRREQWTMQMKRGDWKPTDLSCLCEVHFSPEMWEKTGEDGERKLKSCAVPTIFSFPQSVEGRKRKRAELSKTISSEKLDDSMSALPSKKPLMKRGSIPTQNLPIGSPKKISRRTLSFKNNITKTRKTKASIRIAEQDEIGIRKDSRRASKFSSKKVTKPNPASISCNVPFTNSRVGRTSKKVNISTTNDDMEDDGSSTDTSDETVEEMLKEEVSKKFVFVDVENILTSTPNTSVPKIQRCRPNILRRQARTKSSVSTQTQLTHNPESQKINFSRIIEILKKVLVGNTVKVNGVTLSIDECSISFKNENYPDEEAGTLIIHKDKLISSGKLVLSSLMDDCEFVRVPNAAKTAAQPTSSKQDPSASQRVENFEKVKTKTEKNSAIDAMFKKDVKVMLRRLPKNLVESAITGKSIPVITETFFKNGLQFRKYVVRHPNRTPLVKNNSRMRCPMCLTSFSSLNDLNEHKKTHQHSESSATVNTHDFKKQNDSYLIADPGASLPNHSQVPNTPMVDKSNIRETIPMFDESFIRGQTPMVDKSNIKDKTPLVDKPNIRDKTPLVDKPNIRDKTPLVDKPNIRDKTPLVDKPNIRDKTPLVDKPNIRDKTPLVDKPNISYKTPLVDKPNIVYKTPLVDKPNISYKTPLVDKPNIGYKTPLVDKPNIEDKTPLLGKPNIREKTPLVNKPNMRDKTPMIDKPNIKEKSPEDIAKNNVNIISVVEVQPPSGTSKSDKIVCSVCQKEFWFPCSRAYHERMVHGIYTEGGLRPQEFHEANQCCRPPKPEICSECFEAFQDSKELDKHLLKVHQIVLKKAVYDCDTCTKDFITFRSLMYHQEKVHEVILDKEVVMKVKCKYCNKIFELDYFYKNDHLKTCKASKGDGEEVANEEPHSRNFSEESDASYFNVELLESYKETERNNKDIERATKTGKRKYSSISRVGAMDSNKKSKTEILNRLEALLESAEGSNDITIVTIDE